VELKMWGALDANRAAGKGHNPVDEGRDTFDEGCNTIDGGCDAIDEGRETVDVHHDAVVEGNDLAGMEMGSPWMGVSWRGHEWVHDTLVTSSPSTILSISPVTCSSAPSTFALSSKIRDPFISLV